MNEEAVTVNSDWIRLLRAKAPLFIPAQPGFPTCAELDPDDELITLALRHAYHHTDSLELIVSRLAGVTNVQGLARLARIYPRQMRLVSSLIAAWYLSCRPVWAQLGYTGRVPRPAAKGEEDTWLEGDILTPVRRRGRFTNEIDFGVSEPLPQPIQR